MMRNRWLNSFPSKYVIRINILTDDVYTTDIDVDHWSTHLHPLLAGDGVEAVGAGCGPFPWCVHGLPVDSDSDSDDFGDCFVTVEGRDNVESPW